MNLFCKYRQKYGNSAEKKKKYFWIFIYRLADVSRLKPNIPS